MNKKQKKICWIGLIIFVMMGLFPPWVDYYESFHPYTEPSYSGASYYVSGSYGFIFYPPRGSSFVDLTRLIPQWLMLFVICSWFFYRAKP